MDFALRPLTDADIPALQRVYEAGGRTFAYLTGGPAQAGQAANDFAQAKSESGRYQFGIFLDGEMIGLADCRLDAEVVGQAHLGLLLVIEPYDDPSIARLALRILCRWLLEQFSVTRLETSVPAQAAELVAFWRKEGFVFTGRQYRREIGDYAPRFLIMGKDL